MRLNKFLAQHTTLSRRGADEAIAAGRVMVNKRVATLGTPVLENDVVKLDDKAVESASITPVVLLLHKPTDFVCSRDGQGSPTVYDLLPEEYQAFNIAGRLDKDSSGLVLLTNDGETLQELTHPSHNKEKVYEVTLNRELTAEQLKELANGVRIGDTRPSVFKRTEQIDGKLYRVTLEEGRNRQIRRTFEALHRHVEALKRIKHAQFDLGDLAEKAFREQPINSLFSKI